MKVLRGQEASLESSKGFYRGSRLSELRALMHDATPEQLGLLLWHAASYGCSGATTKLLEAGACPQVSPKPGGRDASHETCVCCGGIIFIVTLKNDAGRKKLKMNTTDDGYFYKRLRTSQV